LCRHLLPHLAGGPFPVAGTRSQPETTSARLGGAFRFPWPFEVSDRPGLPRQRGVGRCWQTHWRLPGTACLDGVDDSRGTIRKPGEGDCGLRIAARRRHTRNSTGKDQRPCSIGNELNVATAGCDAPFIGLSRQDEPNDRGYRLDSPWVVIMAQRRPVRSDVMGFGIRQR
jgi:hypothetical protein